MEGAFMATSTNSTITATELAKRLSDILSRVEYQGEHFEVERNGRVIATIGPSAQPSITVREYLEAIKDLPPLDEDFEKDIEEVRAMLPPLNPSEWE
jgi:antitoxin (DNA-binding transcriptional repressor) of toxin-antitoxin stability system